MATYYMRADGTAANKAAATGPTSDASKCMNVTVHNGETFSAGDTIVVSDAGGVYRATLTLPSSGSSGSPITYVNDGTPVLDGADIITGFAASGAWQDAAVYGTANEQADSVNRAYRNIITANKSSYSGTKIRITVTAAAAVDCVIRGSSIGVMSSGDDYDSAPTRITWDTGSSGTTIGAGTAKVSDEIDFVFTKTSRHGVHLDATDRNWKYDVSSDGAYFSSENPTDETMVQTIAYTLAPTSTIGLTKIEVYSTTANVYQVAGITTQPVKVWFDGVLGNKETGTVDLDADGDWYWASDVLYIYSSTDPSGRTIEAGQRKSGVAAYDKNYITLDGLRFEHGNGTYEGLVRIDGQTTSADGWLLDGLVFAEPGQTCIGAFATDSLTIQNCTAVGDGALLTSDFLVMNKGTGATCTTILVDGCTISYMKWGVRSPVGTDIFDGLTVSNNSFSNLGRSAVDLNDGTDILIEWNTTDETGSDQDDAAIHLVDCPVFVIRRNFIQGQRDSGAVGGSGIQSDTDSDGGEIYYNLVLDCDGPGISVIDATDIDIYNNTLYLNTQVTGVGELYLGGAGDRTANINSKNNIIFAGGDVAVEVTGTVSDNANIVLDYNCYYKTTGDWWNWGGSTGDTIAGWRTASSQGANSINADPLLANAGGTTAADYKITSSSPCRNAGTNVGLTKDYFGTDVPQGAASDIGFHELLAAIAGRSGMALRSGLSIS